MYAYMHVHIYLHMYAHKRTHVHIEHIQLCTINMYIFVNFIKIIKIYLFIFNLLSLREIKHHRNIST